MPNEDRIVNQETQRTILFGLVFGGGLLHDWGFVFLISDFEVRLVWLWARFGILSRS